MNRVILFAMAAVAVLPSATYGHCGRSHDIRFLPAAQQVAASQQVPVEQVPAPQPDGQLTLENLEAIALQNNPALAEAQAKVEAARGNWLQVGLRPNPVVGYGSSDIGLDGTAGQQGAFVGQRLITADKLGLNRAVAQQEIARAEQWWAAQQFRVLNDVRIAYHDALLAQHRVAILEKLLTVSEEASQVAEQLLQAQEGNRIHVLQSMVEADTVRIDVDNAKSDHLTAWRELVTVVGTPGMPMERLAGDYTQLPPTLHWDEAVQTVLRESPEISMAVTELERARWKLQRAYAGRVPDIDMEAAVKYDNAAEDTIAEVRIAVPLQLFDRNQGNIREAEAEVIAAQRAIQRLELDLQNRLANTFNQYHKARQQAERFTNSILPNARSAYDLVQQAYRNGESGYLDVLTAQRTLVQANLSYLNSLEQVRNGEVQVRGLLLTGSLASRP